MNVAIPHPPTGTQAAEGLRRRAFTVAEVERMVEVGLLHEDERLELVGGELVMMSPKGYRHEVLKQALIRHWVPRLPPDIELIPETTFRLSEDTYLEPDIVIYETRVGLAGLNGDTALLALEIAETSLGYDLGRKAQVYAAFGVRELWVIDALQRITHVHPDPTPLGYRTIVPAPATETIAPRLAKPLSLWLADLDLSR